MSQDIIRGFRGQTNNLFFLRNVMLSKSKRETFDLQFMVYLFVLTTNEMIFLNHFLTSSSFAYINNHKIEK